ncbi:hypothetical protein HDU67_001977 [Dinochytrium kinnereticum]|nr:hypothetical protein HDU67_001977 [Dinochytrium kinnereticum]
MATVDSERRGSEPIKPPLRTDTDPMTKAELNIGSMVSVSSDAGSSIPNLNPHPDLDGALDRLMQDLEDDETSDNVDNAIPISSRVVGYIGSVSDLDTHEKEKPTGLAPLVPSQTTSTLLQPLKHVLSVPILKVENEHGKSEVVMDDDAEDYVDEDFEFEEDGDDDDDFFNQPLAREVPATINLVVSLLDPEPVALPLDTKPSDITPGASREPATTDSSAPTFPSMNPTLASTPAPQKPVAALAPLSNLPPAKPILGSLPPLQSKLPGLGGLGPIGGITAKLGIEEIKGLGGAEALKEGLIGTKSVLTNPEAVITRSLGDSYLPVEEDDADVEFDEDDGVEGLLSSDDENDGAKPLTTTTLKSSYLKSTTSLPIHLPTSSEKIAETTTKDPPSDYSYSDDFGAGDTDKESVASSPGVGWASRFTKGIGGGFGEEILEEEFEVEIDDESLEVGGDDEEDGF